MERGVSWACTSMDGVTSVGRDVQTNKRKDVAHGNTVAFALLYPVSFFRSPRSPTRPMLEGCLAQHLTGRRHLILCFVRTGAWKREAPLPHPRVCFGSTRSNITQPQIITSTQCPSSIDHSFLIRAYSCSRLCGRRGPELRISITRDRGRGGGLGITHVLTKVMAMEACAVTTAPEGPRRRLLVL